MAADKGRILIRRQVSCMSRNKDKWGPMSGMDMVKDRWLEVSRERAGRGESGERSETVGARDGWCKKVKRQKPEAGFEPTRVNPSDKLQYSSLTP